MEKRPIADVIKDKAEKDPGFAIAHALLEIDDTLKAMLKVFSAHEYEKMLGDKANAAAVATSIDGVANAISSACDPIPVIVDPASGPAG